MVKIISAHIENDYIIRFEFSDGVQKDVDFISFISKSDFTKPLLEREYFKQMQIYENGRGIFWPNGYDFCPDNLRYFIGEEESENLKTFAVHEKSSR